MKRSMLCAVITVMVVIAAAAAISWRKSERVSLSRNDANTIALGNKLFRDPRLSADGKVSCATCHVPERFFTDGRPVAVGIDGKHGTRNTPSLNAVAASARTTFFWDGRRDRLEDAVMDPFGNPVEMGLIDRSLVATRLTGMPDYALWLGRDLEGSFDGIERRVAEALAAYVRSVSAAPTRFERYTRGEVQAIDEREKLGMRLFAGKGQCATCHRLDDAHLSDNAFHRSGVTMDDIAIRLPDLTQSVLERGLQGGALGDRVATHRDEAQLGHFAVSRDVADIESFATPSLRNVRFTAPYMHDGSVETLDDAIDREVYYRSLDTGYPIGLTARERADLRAFLDTL